MPPALAPLVLASASPRRAELLAEAGLEFETAPAQLDESAVPGEPPGQTCRRLAAAKAAASAAGRRTGTVLGGDTLIEHEGHLLGKPCDEADAAAMLAALAGRRHRVWSAVALVHAPTGLALDGLEGADVELLPLSAGWLPSYLESGEWRDKAGAYAIQGRAASFARLVDGELDTVVGMPRRLLGELLARLAASVENAPR
jgi:septum formation protein